MIKDVLLLLQGLPGTMVRPDPENDLEHVLTVYGSTRLNAGLQRTILRLAAIGGQYKCVYLYSHDHEQSYKPSGDCGVLP